MSSGTLWTAEGELTIGRRKSQSRIANRQTRLNGNGNGMIAGPMPNHYAPEPLTGSYLAS